MKNKSKALLLAGFLAILCALHLNADAQDFKDINAALAGLKSQDFNESWSASKYLAARPQESTRILMHLVENKDPGWIPAMQALTFTKQEGVVLFYIRLLEKNFYNKDESGERIHYGMGSRYGCTVLSNIYGEVLAEHLGELGDKRAIPVLERALIEGDPQVRKRSYWSLYQLEAISLDKMFQLGKSEKNSEVEILEIIMRIGWESIHTKTGLALELFERVTNEFPTEDYYVASAYFGQAQCYELLKDYDRAIQSCNAVLRYPQFNDMVTQVMMQREELIKKREQRL